MGNLRKYSVGAVFSYCILAGVSLVTTWPRVTSCHYWWTGGQVHQDGAGAVKDGGKYTELSPLSRH